MEVLRKANLVQNRVRFDVSYVGPCSDLASSVGLSIAGIAALPAALPDGCFVVISGSADEVLPTAQDGLPDQDREAHEEAIIAWLRRTIRPGMTLVSICSGALLAGRAGLLDGHDCTSHFGSCEELARLAPHARVLENRLFIEDRERLTSAGVTAGIDLMLHLVARLTEPSVAVAIARYLVVYLRRGPGDPQMSPWMEGRNHIHPTIHLTQDAIAADPARSWSLSALAAQSGASPRHLSRLFNEQTGMTVPDYVNLLRVTLARELLGQTRLDMERIAERVGFASSRQLRRAWSRFHSAPPRMARAGR
jgi:transcriptional regulator GlxA family with amidase domain